MPGPGGQAPRRRRRLLAPDPNDVADKALTPPPWRKTFGAHSRAAGSADIVASMTESLPHYVYAEDTATAVESCVVDGRGDDGSAHIAIDRADVGLRVASADLSVDGLVSDRIVGSAPGKHIAELRVAQYLVSRLNQLSDDDWPTPELVLADARHECGVDCIARKPSGEELQIQVTTTEREVWQRREDIHADSQGIEE
jgi:hypothetical protein